MEAHDPSPMKVALLGANSFLARTVQPQLISAGNQLGLFSRQPAAGVASATGWKYFKLPEFPAKARDLLMYDAVIFAVATGVQAKDRTPMAELYWTNALYPLRLMSELDDVGWRGRWISFGTYFEIGNGATSPLAEDAVLSSLRASPMAYCDSKRLLSRGTAFGKWSFPVHHFILPTIYGRSEDSARIIPYVVGCLTRGEAPNLSSGAQVRQYLHIRDVGRLVVETLAGRVPAGCFNVAPDSQLKVADLVRMVYHVLGHKMPPPFGTIETRDETMQYLALDAGRLHHVAGWSPEIKLEDGIFEYLNDSI